MHRNPPTKRRQHWEKNTTRLNRSHTKPWVHSQFQWWYVRNIVSRILGEKLECMKFYKLGVPFWVKTLAMGKFVYEAWEDQFSPTSGFQLRVASSGVDQFCWRSLGISRNHMKKSNDMTREESYLVGGWPTPLKNDGVRQWEGWHPIYEMEK